MNQAPNVATIQAAQRQSPIQLMASRLNVNAEEMQNIVIGTLMKAKNGGNPTNEELIAFLAIANEYRLNPIAKEIYAFSNRGAIQPIVSIDGWLKIINGNPQFDGMEYVDNVVDGQLFSVTCRIYRKDRTRPTEVTEYMSECAGTSEPWKKWPARMLRHKATIQCARYAFGLSGIIDEDEAERYKSTTLEREVNPAPSGSVSRAMDAMRSMSQQAVQDDQPATIYQQHAEQADHSSAYADHSAAIESATTAQEWQNAYTAAWQWAESTGSEEIKKGIKQLAGEAKKNLTQP